MDNKETHMINKILGLILIVLILSLHGTHSQIKEGKHPSTDIRLILQTSKKSYRVGEPIEVTVFLENGSKYNSYYVGRDITSLFTTNPVSFIELLIYNKSGKEVSVTRAAADSIVVRDENEISLSPQKQDYIELPPGTIYGTWKKLELNLRPGIYKFHARYRQIQDPSQKANNSLQIPIWTQTLTSNSVSIRVIR